MKTHLSLTLICLSFSTQINAGVLKNVTELGLLEGEAEGIKKEPVHCSLAIDPELHSLVVAGGAGIPLGGPERSKRLTLENQPCPINSPSIPVPRIPYSVNEVCEQELLSVSTTWAEAKEAARLKALSNCQRASQGRFASTGYDEASDEYNYGGKNCGGEIPACTDNRVSDPTSPCVRKSRAALFVPSQFPSLPPNLCTPSACEVFKYDLHFSTGVLSGSPTNVRLIGRQNNSCTYECSLNSDQAGASIRAIAKAKNCLYCQHTCGGVQ